MAELIKPPKTLVSRPVFGTATPVRYYQGNPGSLLDGLPYEYSVDVTVIPQFTSDEYSVPTPFEYNAYNVEVGDWLGQPTGLCYLITSITSVTRTSFSCICNDL